MLEEQYILAISPFVKNFKKTGTSTYHFSCLECDDYKWSPTTPRANVFMYKGRWVYHCYRCGANHSFPNFLKEHFPEQYESFVFDNFGSRRKKKSEDLNALLKDLPEEKPTFKTSGVLNPLLKLKKDMTHPAVEYLKNRGLGDYIDMFYYTDNFKKYVNEHAIPEKFENDSYPDPRIVLPFFDKYKKLIGMQGRTIDKNNKVRYITVKLASEDTPLIFGMDNIDETKPVYVLEGPLDSLFIPNAVAWAGGSLHTVKGVPNPVLVWDNEPRAKQIIKQMEKAIKMGHKIMIWDKKNHYKDVNEMIMAGLKIDGAYFDKRTYQGLEAQLEIRWWRKA